VPSYRTYNIVWPGNSIQAGNHVGGPPNDYPSMVIAALPAGATGTSHNIAVPSSSIDNAGQGATADGLYDGTKQVNICVVEFGVNDIAGGESAATFVANLKTFCLARRAKGFKVVVCTIISWGSINATRDAANALIRADPSFYDGLADIGNNATTMGADNAYLDTSIYQADNHPTILGNQNLEAVIEPVIENILLLVTASVAATAGSYVESGIAATVQRNVLTGATAGAYVVAGAAATFTIGSGSSSGTLALTVGTYAASGRDLGTAAAIAMVASAGSLVMAGAPFYAELGSGLGFPAATPAVTIVC
jgi:hypothetical protein